MKKTMVRFFTIVDFAEEEIWLREQHKKGWKLVRLILPCFYIFEACEPEDVIYRLDYRNKEQTAEYMQMMEDFGWEYFAKCAGWLYFRKPAAAASARGDGELFSDNASRMEQVSHLVRTRFVPLCIVFLGCVVPNFLRAFSGSDFGGLGLFLGSIFGILFVLYVFLIIYCGIRLKRLKDEYQTNA